MYDTVAGITNVSKLPAHLFDGGMIREDFDTGRSSGRMWANPRPDGPYLPRVTYWPDADLLKVECSIPKLLGVDEVSDDQLPAFFDLVNGFLAYEFGPPGAELPDFSEWTCQRVDYVAMWEVSDIDAYLSYVDGLHVAGARRHSFRGSGTVWKRGNRWVKFYHKGTEDGSGRDLLRFEVSNYRDAVRYMSSHWFCCDQTVGEMLQPGRALYALAVQWQRLGLHAVKQLQSDELLVQRVRELFGSSASSALGALQLIRSLGRDSVRRGLISNSSYALWRKRFLDHGLLARVDDDLIGVEPSLVALKLPVDRVFNAKTPQNLNVFDPPGLLDHEKKFREIFRVCRELPGWLVRQAQESEAIR